MAWIAETKADLCAGFRRHSRPTEIGPKYPAKPSMGGSRLRWDQAVTVKANAAYPRAIHRNTQPPDMRHPAHDARKALDRWAQNTAPRSQSAETSAPPSPIRQVPQKALTPRMHQTPAHASDQNGGRACQALHTGEWRTPTRPSRPRAPNTTLGMNRSVPLPTEWLLGEHCRRMAGPHQHEPRVPILPKSPE